MRLDMEERRKKLALQEAEYQELPAHWTLRKSPLRIYLKKTLLMAEMLVPYRHSIKNALDVGCGDGRGTRDLARYLPDVEFQGVDFSERAIAFARLLVPNVELQVNNAVDLPFADEQFQLVVSREVIEHIPPDDIPSYLQEIRRVLLPNGLLLLTTPSTRRRVTPKHFQHFTPGQLSQILSQQGFDIVDVVGQGWWPPCQFEDIYKHFINVPLFWRIRAYTGTRKLNPTRAAELLLLARKQV